MEDEYKVLTASYPGFWYDCLLHRRVCKAIACISRHVDNGRSGSGRPLFSLKYWPSNWHREWGLAVNRVDWKQSSLYAHCTFYFRAVNLHCWNFFASLILVVGWTYEKILTPNFSQFYGMTVNYDDSTLQYGNHSKLTVYHSKLTVYHSKLMVYHSKLWQYITVN